MEDGKSLKQAKAFTYNLSEKIKIYGIVKETSREMRKRNNSVTFVKPENEKNLRAF